MTHSDFQAEPFKTVAKPGEAFVLTQKTTRVGGLEYVREYTADLKPRAFSEKRGYVFLRTVRAGKSETVHARIDLYMNTDSAAGRITV